MYCVYLNKWPEEGEIQKLQSPVVFYLILISKARYITSHPIVINKLISNKLIHIFLLSILRA